MNIPLCIDLDGTLIYEDTTQLATLAALKTNPLWVFMLPLWLLGGLAYLKRQLAQRVDLDPKTFHYNTALLEWIKAEKAAGRKIILVSATDKKFADIVAKHLPIFDDVLASDGKTNLRSRNKAAALDQHYGFKNYDYAGNSLHDLPVWRHSRQAIVVNANPILVKRAQQIGNVSRVFPH